jgi:cytidylate kinase
MNLAVSGLHGTGKSTIAKFLAEKLHLNYYSTGMMFREIAKEKGMTLEQLSVKAEKDKRIDLELDSKIKAYADKGNCVLDNQLSPYLIKNIDFCVLLKCDRDVRFTRMADRDTHNIDQKIHETLVREESEYKRFLSFYGVDLHDANKILELYDLIIDTTHLDIMGVENAALCAINEFIRVKSIKK